MKTPIALALLLLLLASCGDVSPTTTLEVGRTKIDEARAIRIAHEIRYLENELMQHHALQGEWPEDWTFIHRSALDPWDREYEWYLDGEQAVVWSAGPDGEVDTEDDIRGR